MQAEGKKSVQESLQEWAQKQLESMIQSQIPEFKFEDMDSSASESTFSALQDQTRTYKLSQAIDFKVRPNGQLPMVSSLLAKDADLSPFFATVDLNSRPYFNLDLVVSPPAKAVLTGRHVESLNISKIAYGGVALSDSTGKEVRSLQFLTSAAKLEPVKLGGTFDARKQDTEALEYSYIVTYSDGTAPYKVTGLKSDDDYQILFSANDLGVVYATLSGRDLPWGIADQARVTVAYDDVFTRQFILTNESPTAELAVPIGRKITKPLKYQVELILKGSGDTIRYPVDESDYESAPIGKEAAPTINLKSGIGRGNREYSFSLEGDEVKRAQIRAVYELPIRKNKPSVSFVNTIELSAPGKTSVKWTVPLPATSGTASMSVVKAKTYGADGKAHTPKIENFDPDDTEIKVSLDSIKSDF
jgi:hypothetical protein